MIDESNGVSPYVVDTRFPASPQESRKLQELDNSANYAASGSSASGNWSFELNDRTNNSTRKDVALALTESDHVVFGSGSIAEGNSTQQVTASGLEDGNRLDLNLTTLGSVNLYMLSLITNGDSAAGEYRALSADGQS